MDPYEIWQEALAEIEKQKQLADIAEILGDKMDEEKESYTKLVRKMLVWRGIFLVITIAIIGLLTIALVDGKLNAWEFLVASIVWFGLSLLFVWGTDMPKKEQEDAGE